MVEKNGPRILALNPGSASTKLACFDGEKKLFTEIARHEGEEMEAFRDRPMADQLEFRLKTVDEAVRRNGIDPRSFDAVVGRGGLLEPLRSGTYRVSGKMIDDLREARRGEHASNLGALMAGRLADAAGCPAFIVDPVSVDEWPPVARLSGLAGLDRECLSHALNTKAVAKRFAREQGKKYEELRLVVAHLGSGISISAHREGRMVDVTNSREEGAFSTERAGTVPVMKLVDLCFSGEHTRKDVARMIFREGGIFSYLGTKDVGEVLRRIDGGDEGARLVLDCLVYQIAKEIGAMATVLAGKVDGILFTGGMVHAGPVVDALAPAVGWIAPVHTYPGEDELQALSEGALRVLRGEEEAREYA